MGANGARAPERGWFDTHPDHEVSKVNRGFFALAAGIKGTAVGMMSSMLIYYTSMAPAEAGKCLKDGGFAVRELISLQLQPPRLSLTDALTSRFLPA